MVTAFNSNFVAVVVGKIGSKFCASDEKFSIEIVISTYFANIGNLSFIANLREMNSVVN